jgi:hypothetical protein
MSRSRYKVTIHCKNCGERFILRGRKNHQGKITTGFKRCLCENESDFEVQTEEL